MEIKNYLDILVRRMFTIGIVVATALILVSIVGFFITPIYQAVAVVRVLQDVGIPELVYTDEQHGDRLMRTYVRVLTSRPTLIEAATRSGRPNADPDELYEQLTVEVLAKTELLRIIFLDSDPQFVRDYPNHLSDLLIEHVESLFVGKRSATQVTQERLNTLNEELRAKRAELARLLAEGASTIEIETLRNEIVFIENSYNELFEKYELALLNEAVRANSVVVIEPAILPTLPINGLSLTDVIIATLMGVAGGIAFALVLENLDTRIHSPLQLRSLTSTKVIGIVPKGDLNLSKDKPAKRDLKRLEAYRLLATNLAAMAEELPAKKILVTSPMSKEGKSTVSGNLAQLLSEQHTVFLIESDLRQPVFNERFDLNNRDVGLSSFLVQLVTLDRIVQPTDFPSLFVISSGPPPPNPTQLLDSPAMKELLHWVDSEAQMTIVDAPSVVGLADVTILAPKIDGVILVVNEGRTTKETLTEAIAQLNDCKAVLLGVVFVYKRTLRIL